MKPLSIIQFTPFPRERAGGVNSYVDRISEGLAERGHSVLIAAPGGGRTAVQETKREIARLADEPGALLQPGEAPKVLSLGGVSIPRGSRKRQAPASVDVGNRVEALLGQGEIDLVHVHDPFLPNFSSTALRHSFSLNVGTFHETAERPFATQVARPLLEIFFGRLDARTASSRASAKLLNRYFPGAYDLTPPGVDPVKPSQEKGDPLRIAFSDEEEKGALRLFLRALRRLPTDLDWTATIYSDKPGDVVVRISKSIARPDQGDRSRAGNPGRTALLEPCLLRRVRRPEPGPGRRPPGPRFRCRAGRLDHRPLHRTDR